MNPTHLSRTELYEELEFLRTELTDYTEANEILYKELDRLRGENSWLINKLHQIHDIMQR